MEQIREQLEDESFKNRHRQTAKAFTRVRRLPFGLLMVLMMRKSVKSLQNLLNEAMLWLEQPSVTASAYSQARHKLKHTAFIELNQTAIVNTLYGDGDYQRFWGFRLLAIDGSKLVLPDTTDVRKEFGTIAWTNGNNTKIQGERPYALASVMYDVLNRVAVDALLDKAKAYEVDLALAHLAQTQVADLLIMDRNYPSYRCLAAITLQQRDFVIRCSAKSFATARQMLKGEGADSQIVTLSPCAQQLPAIQQHALPTSLTVRFVRVRLSTGEDQVLVTSLLDEILYPTTAFLELYHLRWGIETFYGLLKTRLALENFTGDSVESVQQDFYATVFLSGLESLLTNTAQARLDAKNTRHRQTVNRAVSFNAIKNQAFELLLTQMTIEPLLEKLTALFVANPCLNRNQRQPTRKKSSARVLLNFQKQQKKYCF